MVLLGRGGVGGYDYRTFGVDKIYSNTKGEESEICICVGEVLLPSQKSLLKGGEIKELNYCICGNFMLSDGRHNYIVKQDIGKHP